MPQRFQQGLDKSVGLVTLLKRKMRFEFTSELLEERIGIVSSVAFIQDKRQEGQMEGVKADVMTYSHREHFVEGVSNG